MPRTRRRISAEEIPPSWRLRDRDRSINAIKSGFVLSETVSRSVPTNGRITAVGVPWSVTTKGSECTPSM